MLCVAALCVAEICMAEICVEEKHVNQSQKKRRKNKHQNHLPTAIIHHVFSSPSSTGNLQYFHQILDIGIVLGYKGGQMGKTISRRDR